MSEPEIRYEVEVKYGSNWHSHGYPKDDPDKAVLILGEHLRGTLPVRLRKVVSQTLLAYEPMPWLRPQRKRRPTDDSA